MIPVVELQEAVELLRNGASIKQSEYAGGTPITRIETIADWNINPERCGYADISKDDFPNYILQVGDILISHINSTKHLGKCAMYKGVPEKLIHGMNLLGLRVNADVAYPDYIYRVLSSQEFRRQLPRITKNSVNQSSFTVTNFKSLKIPLPPLKEQKRIAAILDKADAIRRKRQQAIDLTDQLLRSVFLDIFSDPAYSMTVTELLDKEYLFLHKDGNHGGNYPRKEEFGNEGIPFISAKDISEDDGKIIQSGVKYLKETKAQKLTIGWLEKGDVLLAHNATVGRVGIFQGEYKEALIGTSLTAFRPNPKKLMSQYLFCALKYSSFQEQLKKNMGQSTRNQVPITAQKEMRIPIGDLVLQKKFREYFDYMLRSRVKYLSSVDYANKCFASLTQQAFNGELIKQIKAA